MSDAAARRLSPANVRTGLRIRGRTRDAQDRVIRHVTVGQNIQATGVVSGRDTWIDWHSLSRYDLVDGPS